MKYVFGVFVAIFICFLVSCSPTNKVLGLEDDHFIEEKTEDLINSTLQIDVDLSADSSECGCLE